MERTDLQHDAFKINGIYLEDVISGYMTYKASGRESLEKKIDTYENGMDGTTIKRTSFPTRTIEIDYAVQGSSLADMRSKMHALQTALNVENAEIIFNDDPDCYYIATPVMDNRVGDAHNASIGKFDLICHDPFKYSRTLTTVNTTSHTDTETDEEGGTHQVTSQVLTTDNDGGYKAFPVFKASFATDEASGGAIGSNADCGYILFAKGGTDYSVQIGDDKETDTSPQSLVAQDLKAGKGSFTTANSTPSPFTTHVFLGSSKAETNASKGPGLKASGYGTAVNGKYYGPCVVANLGSDVTGAFEFSWKEVIACAKDTATGKKQAGSMWVLLLDNSNAPVYGIGINKKSTSSLKGAAYRYTPEAGLESLGNVSLAYTGRSGFRSKSDTAGRLETCKIVRYQDEEGIWYTSFTAPNTSGTVQEGETVPAVRKAAFIFCKYSNAAAFYTNRVTEAKFIDGDYDSINSFGSGDVAVVDCGKAEILLNNKAADDLGDVGNDWEDMYLDVGTNTIYVQYSDWVAPGYEPTITMQYRKRWL